MQKNNFQWTPLHFAFRSGNLEAVTLLIELGANINAVAINGATPIMRAIEKGKPDIVKLLIERGANLSALNRKGKQS